ncbi:hypothetical protein HA075_05995 [bacterium BFN5]|nr:hypothetical protein HA075_05810 [bacterium BFN5]QJW45437.1 hypothetical protein HA075_05995 [bacterium BFN5]
MNFVIANKWLILMVLEMLAWVATLFLLYARYQMKSRIWFRVATGLVLVTGVIPQVTLGIVNYTATQEVDLFTLVIVVLIIYGMTLGKKQIKQLDAWAQKKFSEQSSSE